MADSKPPRIVTEPPIPTTTEFSTVDAVRSVICDLDAGSFLLAALLIERMLWNPRFRAVLETRLNGLMATEIRWRPARENAAGRRAAKALTEDWPFMAPTPARKAFHRWGLLLGVAFAQRRVKEAPTSGRLLPQVQPYWPGWATWLTHERCYQLLVDQGGVAKVGSPQLGATLDPAVVPWIVSEPFGPYSWRDALVHAAWRSVLGHDLATRDQNRASEKIGIGILKASHPRGAGDKDKAALARFLAALRSMGREGNIPLELDEQGKKRFDVEVLEFNGTGGQAIAEALNSAAMNLAILFLGHNLTTEVKGGAYAAAAVGDYIRDDVKVGDTGVEAAWVQPQLVTPWAAWNFGDPELAPIPEAVTDSPAVNQAAAQTYQALGQAVAQLRAHMSQQEIRSLLERFRLPLELAGEAQVQVAAPPAPAPTTPTEPTP